jgi:hypothetical protein
MKNRKQFAHRVDMWDDDGSCLLRLRLSLTSSTHGRGRRPSESGQPRSRMLASVALRTSTGSRRTSVPSSSSGSKEQESAGLVLPPPQRLKDR